MKASKIVCTYTYQAEFIMHPKNNFKSPELPQVQVRDKILQKLHKLPTNHYKKKLVQRNNYCKDSRKYGS